VKLKLGFVGLGKMGQALALRAIQSGYTVYGYNRTKSKVDSIRDRVEILPSISDVVEKSDVILVAVTDDEADEDVILGNHGISDYIRPNKMIIDFSTISPIMSKYINEKLKRKNAYRLEVPLIGGPDKALRGELIALIGGDRSKYEEMSDLIKTFAIRTIYAGDIGDALSLKLAFNLLVAGYAELIAEGLAFVQKMKVEKIMGIQSLAAVAENILIAANCIGLGAHWRAVPLARPDIFKKMFVLPDYVEPQWMILLGHKASAPKPKSVIKEGIFHFNKWI